MHGGDADRFLKKRPFSAAEQGGGGAGGVARDGVDRDREGGETGRRMVGVVAAAAGV